MKSKLLPRLGTPLSAQEAGERLVLVGTLSPPNAPCLPGKGIWGFGRVSAPLKPSEGNTKVPGETSRLERKIQLISQDG